MAKDPAILFYWNDWQGGTMTLTRHQKGCYMDLLAAQFNQGPLSLDQIKTLLGTDQASWTVLRAKFKREVNCDGIEVFFNERMVTEKEKRRLFSEKQKEKVNKRWQKDTAVYTGVLPKKENTNENEIRIENSLEDRGVGEETIYSIEHCLEISLKDERFVRANKTGKSEIEQFNTYLEKQGIYKFNPMDYKKYFAKLKGKYPEVVTPTDHGLSIEDLRKIAQDMDKQNKAA